MKRDATKYYKDIGKFFETFDVKEIIKNLL